MGRVGVSSGTCSGRLFDHAAGGTDFVYATDRYICAYRQTGIFEVSGRGKVGEKEKIIEKLQSPVRIYRRLFFDMEVCLVSAQTLTLK